jgi:micrococcal nuclease
MYEYVADVTQVVDGDTIDVSVDLGFHTYRHERIRLYGIDTPERGQPGWAEATNYVKKWFDTNGHRVVLRTMKDKQEKYGRYLGLVYSPGRVETLNDNLIEAGLAVKYTP